MPGFTIKIDMSQGKKALEDIKRSIDSFGNSLKVTPRTADSLTLALVKMAEQVTALVGAYLPIRYEAMHIECGKYTAPEEIFWRAVLQCAEFLKYEEAKRKKQEEETKRRRK